MTDIATIGFKADYGSLTKAGQEFERLGKSAYKAEKASTKFGKSAKDSGRKVDGYTDSLDNTSKSLVSIKSAASIAAVALSAIGATRLVSSIVDTTAEFQSLEASLVTVTGSAESANEAFRQISQFATETPFALSEVTDAFIKMKAMGLDPSERSLRSYGDTASSMGKSLNQMIEAVADAATGEFERLKEFGIKASQQGDQVAFRFGGVTTTVAKNADEIQKYLVGLGETNFAGGMTRQMDTVGGKLSNMNDQWDKTFSAIGNANSGLIGGTISGITSLASSIEDLFLTTEEWAIKYGHVATEAEKLDVRQRVLNEQVSRAKIAMDQANYSLEVVIKTMTKEQVALFKTTEYYKSLSQQVSSTTSEYDALIAKSKEVAASQEDLSLAPSMDAELDAIEKQFQQMPELNAKYRAEQAAINERYRNNELQADWEAQNRDFDRIVERNKKEEELEADKALMMRKWRQKGIDEEKQAAEQKMQLTQTMGGLAANAFGQLASMQNRESKKGFENYKKFATAQALISTSLAAMQMYASPALPDPISKSAAAAMVVGVGALQVSQIQQQQFQPTQTTAYAKGGVVDSPTFFSTPNSSSNVMGEAGAEAIMPLKRNKRGELGVSSTGGDKVVQFNISAVDAAGIDQLLMQRQGLITNMVRRGM